MRRHVAALALATASAQRTTVPFSASWALHVGEDLPYVCSTPATAPLFPISLSNSFVRNLAATPAGDASAAACAAACAGNCSCQAWLHCAALVDAAAGICASPAAAAAPPTCGNTPAAFPLALDGVQCNGLAQAAAAGADACAAACCASASCDVWQWCPAGAAGCAPQNSCWIGARGACESVAGWVSRARNATPAGPACLTGLLADYGPGNLQTVAPNWVGAARLAPPAPPAQAAGPGAPAFDDAAWERVDLPVDYLARGAPTAANSTAHRNEHGSIPFQNAWLRKTFTVPAGTVLARLAFDGVYRSAAIFLNGALAAQHEEGYTAFSVWLHNVSGAPLAVGGGANVLAIHIDATTYTFELWAYEGAGARAVELAAHASPVSIAPDGVFAPATLAGAVAAPGGADAPMTADARVAPTVDVANAGAAAATAVVACAVVAPGGAVVGTTSAEAALAPGGWARVAPPPVALAAAALWMPAAAPGAPPRALYTLVTTVRVGGALVDSVNVTFGVRNITLSPAAGLFVNGFPLRVRGFSMHENMAGVGAAVPRSLAAFRVRRLLELGANTYRTAHNPPAAHVLDECDAQGLLVWLEARFLRPFDIYFDDLADLVRRDRNHPSVAVYSLCNENGCGEDDGDEGAPPGAVAGAALAARAVARVRALDATRPVVANGHDNSGANGTIMAALDAIGLSYADTDRAHAAFPAKPIFNGESASCQSTRGDTGSAAGVLACSAKAWGDIEARAYSAGTWGVWAGFDYRGESSWPSVSSYYGVLDLAGLAKPAAAFYRVWWGLAAGHVGAASRVELNPPWAGYAPGAPVGITAVAAAAAAQLTVNGAAVGARQPIARLGFAAWTVPFAPGNYSVETFDAAGARLGVATSATPGAPAALRLELAAGGSGPGGALAATRGDAALVTVSVVDAAGARLPWATDAVALAAGGAGRLVGLGNGDPLDHTPQQGAAGVPLYAGYASAVVGVARGAAGPAALLTATAPGLAPSTLSIAVVY